MKQNRETVLRDGTIYQGRQFLTEQVWDILTESQQLTQQSFQLLFLLQVMILNTYWRNYKRKNKKGYRFTVILWKDERGY